MNRSGSVISGLFLALAVLAAAAEGGPESLELTDFMLRYLETDSELDASRLKVQASESDRRAKSYLGMPRLRLSLSTPRYSWRRQYSYQYWLDQLYRGYSETEAEYYQLGLTVTQRLPTGGDLSIVGTSHREESDFRYNGFPPEIPLQRETGTRDYYADVGINLDQPLLGFWERSNEVRTAELQHAIRKAQHHLTCASVTKRAINAFFDCAVAVTRVEISRLDLEVLEQEVSRTERLVVENLASESDLLRARIEENDGRLAVFEARQALEHRIRDLRVVDPLAPPDLVVEDLVELVPFEPEGGGGAPPALIRAEREVEVARLGLERSRRRRFGNPSVSLWYGFQGLGDDVEEARETFRPNRWGGSLSLAFSFPEPGLAAEIETARASLKLAEAAYDSELRRASSEMACLLERVEALKTRRALQHRKVELLEVMAVISRDQQAADVLSRFEVIETEKQVLEARIALAETTRQLNLAWVDMVTCWGGEPAGVFKKAMTEDGTRDGGNER
jgi:outer membrane protein TolC